MSVYPAGDYAHPSYQELAIRTPVSGHCLFSFLSTLDVARSHTGESIWAKDPHAGDKCPRIRTLPEGLHYLLLDKPHASKNDDSVYASGAAPVESGVRLAQRLRISNWPPRIAGPLNTDRRATDKLRG
jgi:hypothetical protein